MKTAKDFLRKAGILGEGMTKWIVKFSDGKEIDLVELLEEYRNQPRWISVKDVLPQTGVTVRCKLPDLGLGVVERVLYRMKHNGKWSDYNAYVTHWQPLPQLPEGE